MAMVTNVVVAWKQFVVCPPPHGDTVSTQQPLEDAGLLGPCRHPAVRGLNTTSGQQHTHIYTILTIYTLISTLHPTPHQS